MGRTNEQISKNMSKIKNKDSEIELLLRKELWRRGLRYRKNYNGVVGKPDIAFPKLKIAVFCDSEFWHGYGWGEKRKKEFKKNAEFWIKKIERNIERDKEVNEELTKLGWTVIRFWGNQIKANPAECADKIEEIIRIKQSNSGEKKHEL